MESSEKKPLPWRRASTGLFSVPRTEMESDSLKLCQWVRYLGRHLLPLPGDLISRYAHLQSGLCGNSGSSHPADPKSCRLQGTLRASLCSPHCQSPFFCKPWLSTSPASPWAVSHEVGAFPNHLPCPSTVQLLKPKCSPLPLPFCWYISPSHIGNALSGKGSLHLEPHQSSSKLGV